MKIQEIKKWALSHPRSAAYVEKHNDGTLKKRTGKQPNNLVLLILSAFGLKPVAMSYMSDDHFHKYIKTLVEEKKEIRDNYVLFPAYSLLSKKEFIKHITEKSLHFTFLGSCAFRKDIKKNLFYTTLVIIIHYDRPTFHKLEKKYNRNLDSALFTGIVLGYNKLDIMAYDRPKEEIENPEIFKIKLKEFEKQWKENNESIKILSKDDIVKDYMKFVEKNSIPVKTLHERFISNSPSQEIMEYLWEGKKL